MGDAGGSEDRAWLSGGRVWRVGDTVRRPAGHWTPAVHRLLAHLEASGFRWAPRALGVDADGNEVLTYVEGRVGHRPWLPELRRERGVAKLAELLRRYHRAVGGYRPERESWRAGARALAPGELVLHGDFGPGNTVWRGGWPVAVLDWDDAGPGLPAAEVARLAWSAVPLRDDLHARSCGFAEPPDRRTRLAALCEAYGHIAVGEVLDAVREAMVEEFDGITRLGSAGVEPWADYLAVGDLDQTCADLAWLGAHRASLG